VCGDEARGQAVHDERDGIVTTIALLILCTIPQPPHALRDSVDVARVDHFYDSEGRLVFDQLILYQWDGNRDQVRTWRLIKSPSLLPVRDWEGGGYVVRWLDGDYMREVRATTRVETWGQEDPELLERETLPKESRRELTPIPLRRVGKGR